MNLLPRSGDFANVPMQPGVDFVRVRFAGDSGDGVQTTGALFTGSVADFGNDFATFPDFPAEIRAPAGSLAGVSTFSINLGTANVYTHGDQPDVLVAFNAAALAAHIGELRPNGVLLIDSSGLTERLWKKAGFVHDPRMDGSLDAFQVIELDITSLTLEAVKPFGLGRKVAVRAKNMWALGLTLWLFGRDIKTVADVIALRFASKTEIAKANFAALSAGHAYGDIHEIAPTVERFDIAPAEQEPGVYRAINGADSLALGIFAGSKLSGLPLYYASYPITPASPLLHRLAGWNDPDITTFQAEDEIAAACAAIGASYGGALGVTASSGPGIALMTEALGFAIAIELPLLVIDIQRAGPSTGMPTKAEQSDLFLAVFGRNGDTPLPVLAASGPADCFERALEAVRIALRHMTPVLLLADGYIANAAEPWRLPEMHSFDSDAFAPSMVSDASEFEPFRRDPETLARNWPVPGTPGLEHRIGGLEKDINLGTVSYDPVNHQKMTEIRVGKTLALRQTLSPICPEIGESSGKLAVLGWGSTHGAIQVAVLRARASGKIVSHIHLRNLWPLPPNIGELLDGFDQILLPEMNSGQLATLLRTEVEATITSVSKVAGKPFLAREITAEIEKALHS